LTAVRLQPAAETALRGTRPTNRSSIPGRYQRPFSSQRCLHTACCPLRLQS